jgi:AcrR family transcriptional regulator
VRTIPARPRLLAAEVLPSGPRQKRSQQKRSRLLAAALALFGENGYELTGIEAIAQRAGVAVGSFYQHFRSKRQVLLVLMEELLEGLEQLDLRLKPAGTIRGGLRAVLQAGFSHDLVYAGAYRAWREAILLDPTLRPLQRRIERWTRARVSNAFESALQLPGARKNVNVALLAQLMDRLFWDLLGQLGNLTAAELEAVLDCLTDLIYHALLRDPDGRTA